MKKGIKLILIIILTVGFYSISHGQEVTRLKALLTQNFPINSTIIADGRWVFNPEIADIEKIEAPLASSIIPNYSFYKVTLTNYLGYHINKSECLIFYYRGDSKIKFFEPMWYSGINEDFLEFFIGAKFENRERLLDFISELQKLLLVGSMGSFENIQYSDSLLTLDYMKINTGKKRLWRKINIAINKNTIVSFKWTNPKTNEFKLIE